MSVLGANHRHPAHIWPGEPFRHEPTSKCACDPQLKHVTRDGESGWAYVHRSRELSPDELKTLPRLKTTGQPVFMVNGRRYVVGSKNPVPDVVVAHDQVQSWSRESNYPPSGMAPGYWEADRDTTSHAAKRVRAAKEAEAAPTSFTRRQLEERIKQGRAEGPSRRRSGNTAASPNTARRSGLAAGQQPRTVTRQRSVSVNPTAAYRPVVGDVSAGVAEPPAPQGSTAVTREMLLQGKIDRKHQEVQEKQSVLDDCQAQLREYDGLRAPSSRRQQLDALARERNFPTGRVMVVRALERARGELEQAEQQLDALLRERDDRVKAHEAQTMVEPIPASAKTDAAPAGRKAFTRVRAGAAVLFLLGGLWVGVGKPFIEGVSSSVGEQAGTYLWDRVAPPAEAPIAPPGPEPTA